MAAAGVCRAERILPVCGSSSRSRVSGGGVKDNRLLPGYVDRYLKNEIKSDEMVKEELPERIHGVFALMHAGKVICSVIHC